MIVYVIQEIGGDENSPDYLNMMINYHYHGETGQLPGNSHLWYRVQAIHQDKIEC